MSNEMIRQRSQKKLLRVTLPNGKVICHRSATMTFIETLVEIGPSCYEKISLENCHLPIISRDVYPRYKDWMKPLSDGWYVNTQSDTQQKYMQLVSIKKQLRIEMDIEIGTDFITSDEKGVQKSKKRDAKLLIKLSNGDYVAGENPIDTLIDAIWEIGPENIKRKELVYKDKPIITFSKQFNGQVQVGKDLWLTVPNQTKDKYMLLQYINKAMKLGMEISII